MVDNSKPSEAMAVMNRLPHVWLSTAVWFSQAADRCG